MKETLQQRVDGLKGLTIERDNRPSTTGRSWVPLAAIIAVVTTMGGAAGVWYYQTTGARILAVLTTQPVEVKLTTISAPRPGDSQRIQLVASGRIVSDRRVNVATKVSGQIVELNVEQGDVVEVGDVLARVEDITYLAQRDEAQAEVARRRHVIARTRAEFERAKAAIVEARANLDFEQRNYERLLRLIDQGQASEFEFRNARSRFDAASASLAVAEASMRALESAISSSEAELEGAEATLRVFQKRLDDCAIRAPISGVILERNAQVGDFLAFEGGRGANANAQLVSIADMTLLRVEVDVSERDVYRLTADQPTRITPDAGRDRQYEGAVMWIDPVGDYAKATVQVKVRIFNPDRALRVDGSAKVEFLSQPTESRTDTKEAFWLPKTAVQLTSGSSTGTVFTVIEEQLVANTVQVGTRSGDTVEILGGVYGGMRIVTEVNADMAAGDPARVVE